MIEKFFPGRKFEALLFDFDGTVVDTMAAHLVAWNQALRQHGLELTLQQHMQWAGRPTRQIVDLLNKLHQTNLSYDEISKFKESAYMSSIQNVKEIVPVVEVIRAMHGKMKMGIVSGSRHKPVETTLRHLKLDSFFEVLVCAEDYVNGKPAPDCFLQAAKALNVLPAHCLVFEDAALGIQAANAAGMACLRVDEDGKLGHKLSVSHI